MGQSHKQWAAGGLGTMKSGIAGRVCGWAVPPRARLPRKLTPLSSGAGTHTQPGPEHVSHLLELTSMDSWVRWRGLRPCQAGLPGAHFCEVTLR